MILLFLNLQGIKGYCRGEKNMKGPPPIIKTPHPKQKQLSGPIYKT